MDDLLTIVPGYVFGWSALFAKMVLESFDTKKKRLESNVKIQCVLSNYI